VAFASMAVFFLVGTDVLDIPIATICVGERDRDAALDYPSRSRLHDEGIFGFSVRCHACRDSNGFPFPVAALFLRLACCLLSFATKLLELLSEISSVTAESEGGTNWRISHGL
jgi:hypothetical protein